MAVFAECAVHYVECAVYLVPDGELECVEEAASGVCVGFGGFGGDGRVAESYLACVAERGVDVLDGVAF